MSAPWLQRPEVNFRSRLLHRGAYQWYAGTSIGLIYQTFEIVYVWTNSGSIGTKVAATALLAVFYLGYVLIPPLIWPQGVRTRFITLTIYWLASFALVPFLGVYTIWVWSLVVAMVCFCWMPIGPTLALPVLIVITQVLFAWHDNFDDGTGIAAFVTVTILISLLGITRQIVANNDLRVAQAQIASLAAAEERARLARDLHDVLGHSLTVVAVKSELAGRLVERDPKRALAEIADIEALARTALIDLRAAVSSYRDMNLESELAAARTALDAADIRSHLPSDASEVDADLRSLFGWALREGVTNVIRHSRARQCWVELTPHSLVVRDDGRGKASDGSGSGLKGLTERASESGATVTATTTGSGGFALTVTRATK